MLLERSAVFALAALAGPALAQGNGGASAPPAPSPSQAGGGSQQVVVNPPSAQQPPPPSSVTVNPPPGGAAQPYGQSAPVIVERESERSALEIVAVDAAFGALAGALVGGGVTLLEQGDHWARDLSIGTGAGIMVGAVVGGIQAYDASNRHDRARLSSDGLGTPDRDPPLASARTVAGWAGRF